MTDFHINRRAVIGAGVAMAGAAAFTPGHAATLAPNVSAGDFNEILREFRAIVGEEWVFSNEENLISYGKNFIPDVENRHAPVGAVAPASVEEVQAIVGVANRYKQPLWPISTGKNMGYGCASPATPGQFVLDLKRMNRILHVDPDVGTALVEPGVTYQQLHDYLQENDIPLWLDVPTVGPIVSPVGNTLDRGVGYTPYGDHFMFQCGLEVVLPSGEVMRTGMGSIENTTTWQSFKWGYGPYVDGLFSQSNYGIVTKMGMWLMPAPPAYKPFMVRHANMEDVGRIVDAIRPLRVSNLIANGILMMGAAYQLAMFKPREEIYEGADSVPDDVIVEAAKKEGLGAWNTYFALYGTDETIAATEPVIRAAMEASGGEVLTEAEMGDNKWFRHHASLMRGGLTLEEIGIMNWRGNGGGMVAFAPVAQPFGHETEGQTNLAKEILGKYGFDYSCAYAIGWRDLHHIIFLLFDKTIPDEEAKADACYRELVTAFSEKGWGSYRTGVQGMDLVARQFGEVNRNFNQTLKAAIDPNGIIAPGKSGIA